MEPKPQLNGKGMAVRSRVKKSGKLKLKKIEKFSTLFDFRIADFSDLDEIMEFIRDFWSADHILGTDKDFFVYEHGGNGNKLNFVIAVCRSSNEIRAIQGFIPYSNDEEKMHVCGVMSKTHPDNSVPFLGLETMNRMLQMLQPVSYCGIGTNPKTMMPLVKKFFKRHVGVMSHFYMLNEKILDFKVAIPSPEENLLKNRSLEESDFSLEILRDREELENTIKTIKISPLLPFKNVEYIVHRYFNNPIYTYKTYKILDAKRVVVSLLVTREVECNDISVLNWVDYIGEIEKLGELKNLFQTLMYQGRYEYIDCLCDGIADTLFDKIGFSRKEHDGNTIIPTYFEPFIQKNVKIHFEKSERSQILFKGDSDADRPSKSRSVNAQNNVFSD